MEDGDEIDGRIVFQVSGLNFNVQGKDRWGFSYAGTDDVPVR